MNDVFALKATLALCFTANALRHIKERRRGWPFFAVADLACVGLVLFW
jgi:hypothetical protein